MKIFRKLKYAAAAVVLACAATLFVSHLASVPAAPAVAAENELPAGGQACELEGYQSWTKVNPEPHLMAPQVAMLCGLRTTPGRGHVYDERNPHYKKFITVYVNDTGRKAMVNQKEPKFPVGSVIVKEKLPARDSRTPELLTVMIKQKKGFNPANGDWEYMVVDGTGTKVEDRGKLQKCQGCHIVTPETDYVFRSYLPDEVKAGLK